jgi:hypothetical protein
MKLKCHWGFTHSQLHYELWNITPPPTENGWDEERIYYGGPCNVAIHNSGRFWNESEGLKPSYFYLLVSLQGDDVSGPRIVLHITAFPQAQRLRVVIQRPTQNLQHCHILCRNAHVIIIQADEWPTLWMLVKFYAASTKKHYKGRYHILLQI